MANNSIINPAVHDPCSPPVFVLTASRSGSTLMRFILDSHPELACPPETGIASACAALVRSWDVLENAESGQRRQVTGPVSLPPHVTVAVREAVDQAFGHYLRRRGKRRWCDKSLDSYQAADLVTQVYPAAKFICLFRHPMDVIASGVEVCPWGLHRFGFDPFVAQYPGNSVAAIGSYWLACTQAMLAFADKHPQACHRVRYEDLVTAPEETAAAIFTFLGAEQVPGITEAAFRTAHEGGGPGDEKIWFTAGVTPSSLGRGVSVPAGALPAQLRQAINETLAKLGYRTVEDDWNDATSPIDPRVASSSAALDNSPGNQHSSQSRDELQETVRAITARVESADDAIWLEIRGSWPDLAGTTVKLIVQSVDGGHDGLFLTFRPTGPVGAVVGEQAVSPSSPGGQPAVPAGDGDRGHEPRAVMIASPATWRSLLDGCTNLVTEITAGRLRCIDKEDTHRIRSGAVHAVAALLQLAKIPMAHTGYGSQSTMVLNGELAEAQGHEAAPAGTAVG